MKIPRKFVKDGRSYSFMKMCNTNMFLYKNEKTGVKETFCRYDLKLIDNSAIDEKLQKKRFGTHKYIVYDKLTDNEREYTNKGEITTLLGIGEVKLVKAIKEHQWINARWFVQREEVWEE